jgi:hypothetical protein
MSTPILNIAELNFDDICENIKNFLATKDEFKDFNFQGSGISYLIDVLAYFTHYNGFYFNMTMNEFFLPSATLRKNVTAIAKGLNYLPRRKAGAEALITFEVKTAYKPTNPLYTITIPAYTEFLSESYHFYTTEEYILTNANSYKFTGIVLRQGEYQEEIFTSDGTANQIFTIENANIDNDGLEVYVNNVLWTNENNLVGVDETTQMYSVELTDDNYVKIIFGDNIIGEIPGVGLEIKVIYKDCSGADGNNFSTFTLNDILTDSGAITYDQSKVTITLEEQSLGGADEETITSIKLNAPKFYEAQNRMVTKGDYEAILYNHALVEKINVWGGEEDLLNPVYGKVWIAIKPPGAANLTIGQKATITAFMDSRNVLTINPVFKDIEYFYVDISGTIYYNQQYESQLNIVQDDVETEIGDFFDELVAFDSMFKNAKFTTAINNLTKIENTNLEIQPYFYFSKVGTGNYNWKLNNAIVEESIDCIISATEGFYDDGLGNILNKNGDEIIGEVDYSTGEIEVYPIYTIAAIEPTNGFRVNFMVNNNDIFYKRERMVVLGTITLTYTRFV